MEARDFRSLGRPAQEALRRRALYLVEHEGMTQAEAARAVGVHRQTVNVWQQRYRERGEDGLLARTVRTGENLRQHLPWSRSLAGARQKRPCSRSSLLP